MAPTEMGSCELAIRVILCWILPPLAVFDRGCGVIIISILLTLLGWFPGTIYTMAILLLRDRKR